jgi:nitrate/nitrite transporter NarK
MHMMQKETLMRVFEKVKLKKRRFQWGCFVLFGRFVLSKCCNRSCHNRVMRNEKRLNQQAEDFFGFRCAAVYFLSKCLYGTFGALLALKNMVALLLQRFFRRSGRVPQHHRTVTKFSLVYFYFFLSSPDLNFCPG